jgi:hypothetical protein
MNRLAACSRFVSVAAFRRFLLIKVMLVLANSSFAEDTKLICFASESQYNGKEQEPVEKFSVNVHKMDSVIIIEGFGGPVIAESSDTQYFISHPPQAIKPTKIVTIDRYDLGFFYWEVMGKESEPLTVMYSGQCEIDAKPKI